MVLIYWNVDIDLGEVLLCLIWVLVDLALSVADLVINIDKVLIG